MTKATYGEFELEKPCVVNKDRYNETISYPDHSGNIDRIQRNGLLGNGTYGEIDNIAMMYTGNKLNTITEWGDITKGFKGSNGNVTYDGGGNMIQDLYITGLKERVTCKTLIIIETLIDNQRFTSNSFF